MEAEPALRLASLSRSFSGRRVVDGLDLEVARGEIMGFLGPNGAGKTTVMNMVMGLLEPDAGEITLLGVRGGAKSRDVRLRVGYLQEKPRIYPEMSARSYLGLFARLYGVPEPERRTAAVLDRVGLTAAAHRRLGTYSRGMQQRACLARVMLHEPEFLLLDEPTLGLDPNGVAEMREIILSMRELGVTFLFSSHQLAEMERICDSVAFMKDGRVIAQGSPDELLPRTGPGPIEIEIEELIEPAIAAIAALHRVGSVQSTGQHTAEIAFSASPDMDERQARAALSRDLASLGLTVLSVTTARRTLEDAFLALSGSQQKQ